MKINKLTDTVSQEKKLVNNGKLPKFSNNIVDLDLYRARHYHKPVDQYAWKPYQFFFINHNISPIDAFVLLCILEFKRWDKPAYHSAIAEYIGCCRKTVQRSLNFLNRRGVISYITGRYDGGVKLPSIITVLIDLPSKHALKSFACKKKAYRERINNKNLFALARRVSNSREKHVQNQNVHLYNIKDYKESIASKNIKIGGRKMEFLEPEKVPFNPNRELVQLIAEDLEINPNVVARSLDKAMKTRWQNELDTVDKWFKRAKAWVNLGVRTMEYDLYDNEKSQKQKQAKKQALNDNWANVQAREMEKLLEKTEITFDKEGFLRAVAMHTKDANYVNVIKDMYKFIEFNEATLTLTNPAGYPKKHICPKLIPVIKEHFPMIKHLRDEF